MGQRDPAIVSADLTFGVSSVVMWAMLTCLSCGQPVAMVPELAGQAVECPLCGGQFVMPIDEPAPPPVLRTSVPTRRRPRHAAVNPLYLVAAIGGVAMLAAFIGLVVVLGWQGNSAAPALGGDFRLVQEFHGRGMDSTPVFSVKDDWAIEWECRGSAVEWLNVHDGSTGQVIGQNLARSNSGYVSMADGGRRSVSLAMGGEGIWRIRIYQGPGEITD